MPRDTIRHVRPAFFVPCVVLLTAGSALASSHGDHRSTYFTACPYDSHGHIKRSSSARRTFLKSKGLKTTAEGCQVDRIKPVAKGGKDTPANMQLLWGKELKAKEATEIR